jgi:hypothetical protein
LIAPASTVSYILLRTLMYVAMVAMSCPREGRRGENRCGASDGRSGWKGT